MTRIDEIKQKIADAKERMTAINQAVETAKRTKNAEERTEFDGLLANVQANEAELKDVQAIERIKIDAPAIITSEQRLKNNTYNLGKGVSEFSERSLTGLEAEIQQELKRTAPAEYGNAYLIPRSLIYKQDANKRTETYANSTGLVNVTAQGLDIIGNQSILDKMGVTKYENLTGVMNLNYAQGLDSDSVAEGSSLTSKSYVKNTDKLEPVRKGHSVIVSAEALATTSIMASAILDADRAIDARIAKDLFAAIMANTGITMTGCYANSTAAVATMKKLLALKAAVLSATFKNPAYFMGSAIYSELQGTSGATIMKTIVGDDGKIAGYNAWDVMNLLDVHDTNKYDIGFGDLSRAYVGIFGPDVLGLLVNPFKDDDNGNTKLVFNKIVDVSFNPYAFRTMRNVKTA